MRLTLFYALLAVAFPLLASADAEAASAAFPILAVVALLIFIKSQVATIKERHRGIG